MKILKVPDEFDMDIYDRSKENVSTTCPYCGSSKDNRDELRYEFRPEKPTASKWSHDFNFKIRKNEVGLRKAIFRKYHIIYHRVKCESCGAEWCGNLADDTNPSDEYYVRDRFSDVNHHKVVNMQLFSTIFIFIWVLLGLIID